MKAIVQDRYGSAAVLEFCDIDQPTPGPRRGVGAGGSGRDGPGRVALHDRRAQDRRIKAGVNLDGTMAGAVVDAGLDRPFMLVAAHNHGRDTDPSWARFWVNLRGWRLNLRLSGAGHNSFTDVQVLIPQLAGVLQLPPEVVQQLIGNGMRWFAACSSVQFSWPVVRRLGFTVAVRRPPASMGRDPPLRHATQPQHALGRLAIKLFH